MNSTDQKYSRLCPSRNQRRHSAVDFLLGLLELIIARRIKAVRPLRDVQL